MRGRFVRVRQAHAAAPILSGAHRRCRWPWRASDLTPLLFCLARVRPCLALARSGRCPEPWHRPLFRAGIVLSVDTDGGGRRGTVHGRRWAGGARYDVATCRSPEPSNGAYGTGHVPEGRKCRRWRLAARMRVDVAGQRLGVPL